MTRSLVSGDIVRRTDTDEEFTVSTPGGNRTSVVDDCGIGRLVENRLLELVDNGEVTEEEVLPPVEDPKDYYHGNDVADFIKRHGLEFDLGNVVKYVIRRGNKPGQSAKKDLGKALDYLQYAYDNLED